MEDQTARQTRQCSADPVFLFLPPVQADYPITQKEKTDIARQASIARGWLAGLRGR